MAPKRKLSPRQLELLVEFAESHRDIALGRFSGGPLASQKTKKAWESVALQLNAVAEGVTKTPDQWRRYWIEYKAKTKTKAADSRRNASGTGGGPNKLIPLSDIEQRILALMGPIAVSGLPGVAIPTHPSLQEEISHQNDPQSTSPTNVDIQHSMDEEWLEDSPPPSDVLIFPPSEIPILKMSSSTDVPPDDPLQRLERTSDDQIINQQQQNQPPATTSSKNETPKTARRRRDERVPRWAYDLETRRIAEEKRQANAMESIASTLLRIHSDISSFLNKK